MLKKVILLAFLVVSICMMSGSASAIAPEEYIDGLWTPSQEAGDPTYMFVNPGGLGDALIYPYYNVRDGKLSIFGVVNTSETSGARVRIRFKEAADIAQSSNNDCDNDGDEDPQGSHEILDFDICLSPGDMWVARVISDANGAGAIKSDDDDTYVQFSDSASGIAIFPERFPNGVPFKYGAANPVSGITADNTREGYFEIIAERRLSEDCGGDNQPDCTCGNLLDLLNTDVDNVLMGVNYIIDMGDASTFGYNAVAIAEFADSDKTAPIASANPTLADNDEDIFVGSDITPVNYILTKSDLYSIHDTETTKGGEFEFIITFPTKKLTQDEDGCDNIFADPIVGITAWNDEEDFITEICEFSPCLTEDENELPYEINVVDINSSNIFTSDVETELVTTFNIGWARIDLFNPTIGIVPHATTYRGVTSFGLPAIAYNVGGFGVVAPMGATHMLPMQYDSNVAYQLGSGQ